MGSDEYTSVGGGGALKLKGAKVQKKKNKKKNKDKQVAKGLVAADNLERASSDAPPQDGNDGLERRTPGANDGPQPADEGHQVQKTESERRFQEIRKKRLLQMAESSGSRPELLKTHKERVEELNTYLSKLSEHHDMPRIGPG